ncbi:MAG TPA: CHASE2 domain-containing protein [Sphingobium sp.]|uniref:CHASE2 domain-containing protein n=1 Tax=Sphingobium sp. TaxID=1912891 RepID=UPI002ECFE596
MNERAGVMERFRPHRLLREWWIVGIAVTALAVLLAYDGTLRRADAAFYDLIRHVDGRAPDPALLIVTIDDESLARLGPWPWPRARHAELIERLNRAGARLVGYDVLFLEPKPGDEALATAMGRGAMGRGMPVFLPMAVERPGLNGADHFTRLPVPLLAHAAAGIGHVGVTGDIDGPVRHAWLWDGGPRDGMAHMVVQIARRLGVTPPASDAPILIPYTGPSGHYPMIDAAAVLAGQVPPELLRGRIILVGATAPGLGDQHPVAVGAGGTMAGVEVQANLLDGLLHRRLIREGGAAAALGLAVPSLWLMLLALRLWPPRRSLMMLGGLLFLLLAGSATALLVLRFWLPPAVAVAMLLLLYPLWSWRRLAAAHGYMTDELERLRQEPDLLAVHRVGDNSVDPVTRQSLLLQDAVGRLRALRAFISAVLDQLPDMVVVTDGAGEILFANASAPLPGLMPEKGQSLATLLSGLRPAPGHAVPDVGALRVEATILLTADDHALSYSLAPWTDDRGAAAGWIARISDITPLRAIEAQREEMLRFLTHDMRSPQASILACLSTAGAGEIDAGLADRIAAYARRTLDLADGFVRLARAETQRYPLAPVNLADIMIDAADDLWPQAKDKGVTIRTLGEEQEIDALADRSLLTRALINLLGNAVKYSAPGGEVRMAIGTTHLDGRAMALCTVEDDGQGVSPELAPIVFGRFASSHEGRGEGEGIGLGLAFVDAVARGHGGRVWCESEPGRGARFCLAIGLAEGEG